jgi:TolB-like protein
LRRIPAVILMFLAAAFVGAAPPAKPAATAKPTAARTPAPTPTPSPEAALPIVIVFPFQASSDLKAGTGEAAAQIFVQQMNADGGIDAIEAPATVAREGYEKYARDLKASYYVAGYMTPLGNGVSLVEQVVSLRSGTIVFGQTAQIQSFQDATAQATAVHDGIIAVEQQITDAYSAAQAQATAEPTESSQANISRGIAGIAGLFKHRSAATPKPVAVKPPKGVFVVSVAGSLPRSELRSATRDLADSLNTYYNVRMANGTEQNVASLANGICGAQRDNTIATGTASAQVQHHVLSSRTTYTFDLQMYACFGAKLASVTGTGDSLQAAIQNAVAAFASKYPLNA